MLIRRMGSASRYRCSDGRRSNPRVPFVAVVFPIAAIAPADSVEAVDRLDAGDEFRHLVAELPFYAETHRRTVFQFQRPPIHLVGENGLGMEGIDEIDALVVDIA